MISRILKYKFRYLLSKSKVVIESGGTLIIDKSVKIINSKIYVSKGCILKISSNSQLSNSNIYLKEATSNMEIGSNCYINNLDIALWKGKFTLGDYSIIESLNTSKKTQIRIDGICNIGKYNRIRSNIWIRFGALLTIGNRNAINENTEIRSDEKIEIGDYNQISYNCDIWDTNTHCIYSSEKRRELTDKQYPDFGDETEKPITSPIKIESDCWIGKNSSILKGTNIGDNSIIGYGTLISGKNILMNSKVISKHQLVIYENKNNESIK